MISALNHGVYGYSPTRKSGMIFAKSKSTQKKSKEAFTLNAAYKPKVIDFVSDLTCNINTSKLANRDLEKSFHNLEKDIRYKNEDNIKENISNSSEQLVLALNNFVQKVDSDNNTPYINEFVKNVNSAFEENRDLLGNIGLYKTDQGFSYNEVALEYNALSSLRENTTDYIDIFSKLSSSSNELSNKSFKDHVNFKDFSYYFNYGINLYENSNLALLGTGNIINLQL